MSNQAQQAEQESATSLEDLEDLMTQIAASEGKPSIATVLNKLARALDALANEISIKNAIIDQMGDDLAACHETIEKLEKLLTDE